MGDANIPSGMLEVFIYETEQMLEQLETAALASQNIKMFDEDCVNEIFRVMHTIKGSSGIMMYTNITKVSHKLEDIFYYIRENHYNEQVAYDTLLVHTFDVADYVRGELEKIKQGEEPDGDPSEILEALDGFLNDMKGEGGGAPAAEAAKPAEETAEQPQQESSQTTPDGKTVCGKCGEFYRSAPTEDSRFYAMHINYSSDTEMPDLRAYNLVYNLKEVAESMFFDPEEICKDEAAAKKVLDVGFTILMQSKSSLEDVMDIVNHSSSVENLTVGECTQRQFEYATRDDQIQMDLVNEDATVAEPPEEQEAVEETAVAVSEPAQPEPVASKAAPAVKEAPKPAAAKKAQAKDNSNVSKQSFISVNINKMDLLMDLIGELVISEALVLQNPDLQVPGLDLTNFNKYASELSKNTTDLQEAIMSIRMMPLTNTFQKMNRIVFDVSRKLGKDIELKIIGEDTEVDKNIIEHISDPLMHMIRNAVDHGIEDPDTRATNGKDRQGTIVLEAKNEGGKVWISVKDDGKGLNKWKIFEKAQRNGLTGEREFKDFTEREIFNFIMLPGFSTNQQVTEYSGRGVGMDVVVQNIQEIGGSLDIESQEGFGTTMTLKIPLTLAIIGGIVLGMGDATYVVPTGNVKEFVGVTNEQIIMEPDGKESIILRGECYPILRLKKYYNLSYGEDDVEKGIVAILEHEGKSIALVVDHLIGEQEIVVKPIPSYIRKVKGLSGCTQLGDGNISLILDAGSLVG